MRCEHCDGIGKSKNTKCMCIHLSDDKNNPQPVPNCPRCGGTGETEYECYYCNGTGVQYEIFYLQFRNTAGEVVDISFDLQQPIPLKMAESSNSLYPEKTIKFWRTNEHDLIEKAITALGYESMEDVFVLADGRYGRAYETLGMFFYESPVGSNRAGHDPDPTEAELQTAAKKELRTRFTRCFGETSEEKPYLLRVVAKPSVDELLLDLEDGCVGLGEGFGFSIIVREGNIATGESGWQVFLTKPKPEITHLQEIGIAYDLAEALANAVEHVRVMV